MKFLSVGNCISERRTLQMQVSSLIVRVKREFVLFEMLRLFEIDSGWFHRSGRENFGSMHTERISKNQERISRLNIS